jgi:acyl-CoA synthetase (AMP-forming)/AMP-acid ligase II
LHVVALAEKASPAMLSYEELLNKASMEEPSVEISENDLISLRYTGGTTGPPKGVIHDHRSNIAILNNILMNDFMIEEGDAIALSGPITHASGFMILPHIVRGAKVILLSHFDFKEFLETIEREKVTTLYLVPTMIVMMLAHPDLKKHDLSSLKTIRYGASQFPGSIETRRRGLRKHFCSSLRVRVDRRRNASNPPFEERSSFEWK